MSFQRLILLCILIIPILNSCRTTKDVSVSNTVLTQHTTASFLNAYKDKVFQYNTLSANIQFEVTISSGSAMSSRGQLRMTKDDRIQISILPLFGFEAFRAELTPDSIKIVDRLNRWYMMEMFDHIKGEAAIDFNFYNLQALITNQLFLPGEINLSDKQFNVFRGEQTNTGFILRTSDSAGLQYTFTADSNEKIATTEINDDARNYMLDCNYKNFLPVGNQIFPMNLQIRLQTESRAQHSLSLNFNRVNIDQPVSMNFTIPANYQRVSIEQIINSIEQL